MNQFNSSNNKIIRYEINGFKYVERILPNKMELFISLPGENNNKLVNRK